MRLGDLGLLGSLALAGCMAELPAPHVTPPLGSTTDVPIAVVTGRSRAFEIVRKRTWGDDSVEAALEDARQNAGPDADAIQATAAERHVICFPLCAFPLLRSVRTTVTATGLRFARGLSRPSGEAVRPELEVGQAPPASALLERLEHLYAQSPDGARELYDSLAPRSRDELRDEVLSSRGVASAYGRTFRLPPDASAAQRAFLRWFVGRYTTYTLVE